MTRDDLPEGSEAREDLERVIASAEGAGNILRDVLQATRNRERTNLEQSELVAAVGEAVSLSRLAAPSNVRIMQRLPDVKLYVHLRKAEVQAFMINIISNAIHAIGIKGGNVLISVEEKEIEKSASLQAQMVRKPLASGIST